MSDKFPLISGAHVEQSPDRLKIVLPAKRQWPYLVVYTVLVVIWMTMFIWGIIFLVQILFSGETYRFVFAAMIAILLFILYRFGRFLGRQWAMFLSNREVLLINKDEIIVRRPVSLFGNTDVYDMKHVSPLYESDTTQSLGFDYGYRHIYFGAGLTKEARNSLRNYLNEAYIPEKAV